MYKLFSKIPLLSSTERQANMNSYFYNKFMSFKSYRGNIYNYIMSNKPKKFNKLKNNSIQFSYNNEYAWLSLIWPNINKDIINKINTKYNLEISEFKLNINNIIFDNIISYIYIKKLKYITNNFIKKYNFININNITNSIMKNNKLIDSIELKNILGVNLDNKIRNQLDSQELLDLFDEILYDWNLEKIEVIRKGIYLKFKQKKLLKKALLNTANKYLIDI